MGGNYTLCLYGKYLQEKGVSPYDSMVLIVPAVGPSIAPEDVLSQFEKMAKEEPKKVVQEMPSNPAGFLKYYHMN